MVVQLNLDPYLGQSALSSPPPELPGLGSHCAHQIQRGCISQLVPPGEQGNMVSTGSFWIWSPGTEPGILPLHHHCLALQLFFFNLFIFIYLWLCWVFVSVRGLSLVAASGGHSSSRCAGLSLSRPLPSRSTGSRRTGSEIVAHGPSCSAACGIFPDQGSNPCPLHWQADSRPLRHQGSPTLQLFATH